MCYEYPVQGPFLLTVYILAMVAIGYVYSCVGLAALLLCYEYHVQGQFR